MGLIENTMSKYSSGVYTFFRIVVGLFFFLHGWSKFGGAEGIFFVAGVVEVLVGAALVLGIFSRLAALGGAVTMVVAFFYAHAGEGLNPMTNGGELAVVYFLMFLLVMVHGNGSCSLESKISNKETF